MFKEILLSDVTDKRGSKRGLIKGIGVNDAPYQTTYKVNGITYVCPYFSRWVWMFTRSYCPHWLKKHPTYIGCYVAPVWHSFMAFRSWMINQDWKGKQLDKDLLSFDSKRYSPDTCLFVTPQINSLFCTGSFLPNELPMGVYKRNNKYEVGVSAGGSKRTWVGKYNTIYEAIDAYADAKATIAQNLAKEEKDPKVKQAILNYSKYFTDRLKGLKTGY